MVWMNKKVFLIILFIGGFIGLAINIIPNLSAMSWWEILILILILLFFGIIGSFVVWIMWSERKSK